MASSRCSLAVPLAATDLAALSRCLWEHQVRVPLHRLALSLSRGSSSASSGSSIDASSGADKTSGGSAVLSTGTGSESDNRSITISSGASASASSGGISMLSGEGLSDAAASGIVAIGSDRVSRRKEWRSVNSPKDINSPNMLKNRF